MGSANFAQRYSEHAVEPPLSFSEGLFSGGIGSIALLPASSGGQSSHAQTFTAGSGASGASLIQVVGPARWTGLNSNPEVTPILLNTAATPYDHASLVSPYESRATLENSSGIEGGANGPGGQTVSPNPVVGLAWNVARTDGAHLNLATPDFSSEGGPSIGAQSPWSPSVTLEAIQVSSQNAGYGRAFAVPAFSVQIYTFFPMGDRGAAGFGGGHDPGYSDTSSLEPQAMFWVLHGANPGDDANGPDPMMGSGAPPPPGSGSGPYGPADINIGQPTASPSYYIVPRGSATSVLHEGSTLSGPLAVAPSPASAALARETPNGSTPALTMAAAGRTFDNLGGSRSLTSGESEDVAGAALPAGTSALTVSYRAASKSARSVVHFQVRQSPNDQRPSGERSSESSEEPSVESESLRAEDSLGRDEPGRAADLYAKFSPFDREALDRAIDDFLGDLKALDVELNGVETTVPMLPGVVAVVFAASAVETIRRRFKKSWHEGPIDNHSDGESSSSYPGLPLRRGPHLWGLERR